MPIARIALAGGPMKTMPGALARLGEGRVLAEEAVARVDRVAARSSWRSSMILSMRR